MELKDLKVGMYVKHHHGFIGKITEIRNNEVVLEITSKGTSEHAVGDIYVAVPSFIESIEGYSELYGFSVGDRVITTAFGHEGVIKSIDASGMAILELTNPKTLYGGYNKYNYSVNIGDIRHAPTKAENVSVHKSNGTNINTNINTDININDSYDVEFELGGMVVRMDYKHFIQFMKDVQTIQNK